MPETEIPVVLRIFADKNASVDATLSATTKRFQDLAGAVGGIAQNAAKMSGAVSLALGGIVGSAVNVAGQFEALQGKLVSVFGNSEMAAKAFQSAVDLAAKTPFDVKSVVAATATIEAFGQSSQRVLPLAANLAAAFGRSMDDVSLILGKAFSGGLEGFESLRNGFGISNQVLKKYGAELTNTGSIAVTTAAQLDKAKTALEKIIQTKFGDATARQSKTLFGALSNLGDAATNLAAGFGQSLVPAFSSVAQGVSKFLNAVNSIPAPIKAAVAATAVLATGLTGVVAAGAAAFAGLLALAGGLAGIVTTVPAAAGALRLVTGALDSVTVGAINANGALGLLAANPVAIVMTGVIVAAGAAGLAIASYDAKMVKAGDSITSATREFSSANMSIRDGIDLLNKAGESTGRTVTFAASSVAQIKQFAAAFKDLSPLAFAVAMDKAGASLEDFKDKLAKANTNVDSQKALLKEYSDELKTLQEYASKKTILGNSIDVSQSTLDRIAELVERVQFMKSILERTEVGKAFFQGAVDKATELNTRLQPLIDSSRTLSVVLDLSKSVGTASALSAALGDLDKQIAQNAATAEVGSANLDTLIEKFRTIGDGPNVAIQKQAILAQIRLIQDKAGIVETVAKKEADAQKEVSDAAERAFRRQQVLNGQSLTAELEHIQDKLKNAAAGSEAEVALLEAAAATKKQIADKSAADSAKSLSSILTAATAGTEQATQGVAEGSRIAQDTLSGLNTTIQTQIADSINSNQKLAAVESGLVAIRGARIKGLLEEEAAQRQINALTKEKSALEQKINQEAIARANAIAGQELDAQKQSLELLKAQVAAGDSSTFTGSKIKDAEQGILAARIQAVRDQEKADLAANVSAEDAARKRELAITAIVQAETIRRMGEEQKQTKAVEDEAKKQEAIRAGFAANRLGGKNSPIVSLGELSATSNLLPNFSFDSFGASKLPKSSGPPSGQLSRVRAGVDRDIAAGEQLGKDTKAQGGFTGGASGSAVQTSNTTNNLSLYGGKIRPEDEPTIRAIFDKYFAEKKHLGEAS